MYVGSILHVFDSTIKIIEYTVYLLFHLQAQSGFFFLL
jgi:hypothetical protein